MLFVEHLYFSFVESLTVSFGIGEEKSGDANIAIGLFI